MEIWTNTDLFTNTKEKDLQKKGNENKTYNLFNNKKHLLRLTNCFGGAPWRVSRIRIK